MKIKKLILTGILSVAAAVMTAGCSAGESGAEESVTENAAEEVSVPETPAEESSTESPRVSDMDMLERLYKEDGYIVLYSDGVIGYMSKDEADIYKMYYSYRNVFTDEAYEAINNEAEGRFSSKEEYVAEYMEVSSNQNLSDYFDEHGNYTGEIPETAVLISIFEPVEKADRTDLTEAGFYASGKWALEQLRESGETRRQMMEKAESEGVNYVLPVYDMFGKKAEAFFFWTPHESDETITVKAKTALDTD
ncbi:MAG: hypothetical protein NC078_12370 [Ruminococcus sp.]|nr:hypothetical protein [Ruminococcus sp.]